MIQSKQICYLVAPAFGLSDFYPPLCFVKFIGFTLAVSTAFKKGSMKLMEGIRFHLCASPLFHACAEGLTVADEFHVQQSFHLAAAMRLQVSRCHIASRLQLRLADSTTISRSFFPAVIVDNCVNAGHTQFSPLGTPSSLNAEKPHRIKEKRLAQEEPAPIVWNCGGTAAGNHFMPA